MDKEWFFLGPDEDSDLVDEVWEETRALGWVPGGDLFFLGHVVVEAVDGAGVGHGIVGRGIVGLRGVCG